MRNAYSFIAFGLIAIVLASALAAAPAVVVQADDAQFATGLRIAVDPLSDQTRSQSHALEWPTAVRDLRSEKKAKALPTFRFAADGATIGAGLSLASTHRFTGRNWYPVVIANTGDVAVTVRVWAIERQWWAHGRRVIDQTRIEPHTRQGFPVRGLGTQGEWYLDVVADGDGPASFNGYVA